ncbi:MAG: hypothetical protein SynsKO_14530 [Synoicihabitans sp.]
MCGGLLAALELSGQSIDPLTPAEWHTRQQQVAREWSKWPGLRVAQLDQEIASVRRQLQALPVQYPVMLQNRLGFHSALEAGVVEAGMAVHQIDFALGKIYTLRAIGIAPAANPSEVGPRAYGFPARFRIEVVDDRGEFVTVADWMEQDFPDPGTLPVVFSDLSVDTSRVRLTVPQTQRDAELDYFALGEFFIWGGNGQSFFAENLAIWKTTTVSASGGFSLPPQWELEYLTDGVSGLGFPLSQEEGGKPDLMIKSEAGAELSNEVEVVIDLQEPTEISRFDLWPAQSLDGLALAGVGFPREVLVDVSNDPEFRSYRPIEPEGEVNQAHSGALFSICVRPPEVRYLRITMKDLPEVDGARVLGLGEVALYDVKGDLVRGEVISSKGVPTEHHDQLSRLLDGYCWERKILSDLAWFEGLARRRPLEQRLALLESEYVSALAIWRYLQLKLIVGGVIGLILGLVGYLFWQNSQKKKLLRKQAEQFRRDLHDEVGSSLGGITLLADELAEQRAAGVATTDLDDLSFMAREASASLGEMVKMGDQEPTRLGSLVVGLQRRAERILRGPDLEIKKGDELPDLAVSLGVKRHITLFFKEAIHNCSRHARARSVWIETAIENGQLRIEIADDGCGFDPEQPVTGWGLSSMRSRAEEIGGFCSIVSQVSEGTKVALHVPVELLDRDPQRPYRSSNL